MEAITRNAVRALLALMAALVAIVAVRASAQSPAAIDSLPGVECAYSPAAGAEICGVELAPGMRVEAPRAAWLPHPDLDGFDVNHGDTQLSVRFCPGSVAAGTLLSRHAARDPALTAAADSLPVGVREPAAAAHHARPRPRREPHGRRPRALERPDGDAEPGAEVRNPSHGHGRDLGADSGARLPEALDRRRADDLRGGRRAPLLLLRRRVRLPVRQAEFGRFRRGPGLRFQPAGRRIGFRLRRGAGQRRVVRERPQRRRRGIRDRAEAGEGAGRRRGGRPRPSRSRSMPTAGSRSRRCARSASSST